MLSLRKENIKTFFNSKKLDRDKWIKKGRTFHNEDIKFLREIIPQDSKILELGCGNGQLLASLNPKHGLGIDFSKKLISEAKNNYSKLDFIEADIEKLPRNISKKGAFDFIIISDTIGYLEDVEETLGKLHKYCNQNTRLIVSYYSPLWAPLLNLASLVKLKMSNVHSTLLTPTDISNFLIGAKFDSVRIERKILIPFKILGLERIINKFLAPLPILSHICLRHYNISRSLKNIKHNDKLSASIIIPCKNELGNIKDAIARIPRFTKKLEVIFVEGN